MNKPNEQTGYILLPVTIIIAVIAALALLSNYESSLESGTAVSELDQQRARYVAEAGFNHGSWLAASQGCGPHTDLTSEPMGSDSYSTELVTDLGTTTSYSLVTDNDAWIRNDLPNANMATDPRLHIRFETGLIERPLFRYDLSPLPVGAAILSATAWFYVNNAHPEGPVDIHLVTADWTESDATWTTLGDAIAPEVVATIPAQPAPGVRVAVNLTAQVQAWVNGAANYGITFNSLAEGTNAEYASKEHASAPFVTVVVGAAPDPEARLKATGDLANGIDFKIEDKAFTLAQFPPLYQELQPDDSSGHDTYLDDSGPGTNWGSDARIRISNKTNAQKRGLLRFDLSKIPLGASVTQATLELNLEGIGSGGIASVDLHRVTTAWNELQATWNKATTATTWNNPGGDWQSTVEASATIDAAFPGPTTWDLTGLVAGWIDGSLPNEGIALLGSAGVNHADFTASNSADPALRPKLNVTFTCACGVVCMPARSSGNILFVVANDVALTQRETDYQRIFEDMGYAVDLISDDSVWLNFDAKAAVNDVVFVSRDVSPGLFGLTPALRGTSLGVVVDKNTYVDDLGFGTAVNKSVGRELLSLDTDHDITRIFPADLLRIYDHDMRVRRIDNVAAGARVLASHVGVDTIITLDTGADLGGSLVGKKAAGRRVMLPFVGGDNFNLSQVNNNSLLLLQRSLDWAMNKQGPAGSTPGLWLSTLNDVVGSGAPGLDAWDNAEALAFSDPGLALEPPTTAGEFSSVINLEDFGPDVNLDALHYVGIDITVGAANAVALQVGDLLLSTSGNETLTSNNSITVNNEDVFVFRPDAEGDYSVGTFIFLLDGSQIHAENDTVGVSLIEATTTVGNGKLFAGDFLFATTNRRDVQVFDVTDVGFGTTGGSVIEFIDGPSLSFGSEIRGLDLAENEIVLGAQTIPAGSILVTLNNDDPGGVGDNLVPADSSDVFYLTVTTVGTSPVADATLLFEGADVNLDTIQEYLQAISLNTLTVPPPPPGPFDVLLVVGDPANLTAQQQAKKDLIEGWGHAVALIATSDSQDSFNAAAVAADVVYVPELGTGPMGELGGKANGLGVGVITEESRRALLLGGFALLPFVSTDSINIIDNTHYLTETLPTGPVQLSATVQNMWVLKPTLAPDLHVLGQLNGTEPALAYVDAGEALNDASPAPARRVKLPWGAYDFDVGQLTDDGLEIMRRAIEWGASGVTGPVAHWKFDDGAGMTALDSAGGNHGTLTNGPNWAPGLIGNALDFDGANDYVAAGSFDVTGSGITMMGWFNADSIPSNDPRIVSKSSGPNEADAVWQLSTTDAGSDRYLRMRIRAGGTTTTLADSSVNLTTGQWYHAVATYDNASGEMKLYLDGVEVASGAHAVGGALDVDPAVPVALGANGSAERFFDGILDDVRVYNRALSAAEIADLHAAGAPSDPAEYTEAYQPWTAATPDNWETVSLASFGVPANAVVEVAVINESGSAQRWGGVRAVGSTVDRRIQLHEAEAGGIDVVTMHVQADASSQIQHYSDNTGQVSFILLGYWTGASYTDALEPFTANNQGSWVEENVGDDGVGPGQVAEVLILNTNTGAERLAGARASGATYQRRFMLQEAEGGGVDALSMIVVADASSIIEVYSANTADIEFYVLGTWDLPPGTYTGTGGAHGSVSAPTTWETIDLTSYGVPADAVAQFVLANENQGLENSMRVREVGSTINNRGLHLHEAESGGSDLGSLHVNVNASVEVQWAAQRGASGGLFYPVGWWVLSP